MSNITYLGDLDLDKVFADTVVNIIRRHDLPKEPLGVYTLLSKTLETSGWDRDEQKNINTLKVIFSDLVACVLQADVVKHLPGLRATLRRGRDIVLWLGLSEGISFEVRVSPLQEPTEDEIDDDIIDTPYLKLTKCKSLNFVGGCSSSVTAEIINRFIPMAVFREHPPFYLLVKRFKGSLFSTSVSLHLDKQCFILEVEDLTN